MNFINEKHYSNDDIINVVKQMFPNEIIVLIYFNGSISYGSVTEDSDIDVTVILKDFNGSLNMKTKNLDITVYGLKFFIDRLNYKENIPLYELIKNDDVLNIKNSLIYLNSSYQEELNNIINTNYNNNFKSYLSTFLAYEDIRGFNFLKPDKRMYHILRMRGLVDHFDKTHTIEMIIEEPWKSKMMDYKINWNNDIGLSYLKLIEEQLHYLKIYKDRM